VKFLKEGRYEPAKSIIETGDDKYATKKEFKKKIGGPEGVEVTFEVYDSVYGFTNKDWGRVVCLFTNGEMF